MSIHTGNTCLSTHADVCEDPIYRERISQIEEEGLPVTKPSTSKEAWVDYLMPLEFAEFHK